jgi:hypothetical protein
VERLNRIVQEMARVMLDESKVPNTFWGEVFKLQSTFSIELT